MGAARRSAPRLVADSTTDPAMTATMPRSNHYTGVASHSDASGVQSVQAGVLLVNLGTPTAPTAKAVRPYLAEFLGDTRVIDYPRDKCLVKFRAAAL